MEEEVTSPTFTLLNVYTSGRLPLYHADMYRAEDEDETYELGLFEDAPEDAVRVIEWNKSSDLTDRVIDVRITSEGDSRSPQAPRIFRDSSPKGRAEAIPSSRKSRNEHTFHGHFLPHSDGGRHL